MPSDPTPISQYAGLNRWIVKQHGRNRYGLILALLLGAFVVGSASDEWGTLLLVVAVTAAFLTITVTTSPTPQRVLLWLLPLVFAAHVAAIAEIVTINNNTDRSLGSGLASLGLLAAPILVVTEILRQRSVTMQTLYAAGAVYLMIGLGFGALYQAIDRLTNEPFFAQGALATEQINYFSFVTLTTLGYGDLSPATSTARALVVVEALIGQIYLATLVARLVTGLRASSNDIHA